MVTLPGAGGNLGQGGTSGPMLESWGLGSLRWPGEPRQSSFFPTNVFTLLLLPTPDLCSCSPPSLALGAG